MYVFLLEVCNAYIMHIRSLAHSAAFFSAVGWPIGDVAGIRIFFHPSKWKGSRLLIRGCWVPLVCFLFHSFCFFGGGGKGLGFRVCQGFGARGLRRV